MIYNFKIITKKREKSFFLDTFFKKKAYFELGA